MLVGIFEALGDPSLERRVTGCHWRSLTSCLRSGATFQGRIRRPQDCIMRWYDALRYLGSPACCRHKALKGFKIFKHLGSKSECLYRCFFFFVCVCVCEVFPAKHTFHFWKQTDWKICCWIGTLKQGFSFLIYIMSTSYCKHRRGRMSLFAKMFGSP